MQYVREDPRGILLAGPPGNESSHVDRGAEPVSASLRPGTRRQVAERADDLLRAGGPFRQGPTRQGEDSDVRNVGKPSKHVAAEEPSGAREEDGGLRHRRESMDDLERQPRSTTPNYRVSRADGS